MDRPELHNRYDTIRGWGFVLDSAQPHIESGLGTGIRYWMTGSDTDLPNPVIGTQPETTARITASLLTGAADPREYLPGEGLSQGIQNFHSIGEIQIGAERFGESGLNPNVSGTHIVVPLPGIADLPQSVLAYVTPGTRNPGVEDALFCRGYRCSMPLQTRLQ